MLIDLRGTELTGKVAEEALDRAHITVNKNTIPFDPRPPFVTSGIRIGTPAVTTRGMREPEMEQIAELIHRALQRVGDERRPGAARGRDVRALCARFPVYRQRLGVGRDAVPVLPRRRQPRRRLAARQGRRRHPPAAALRPCGRRFTTYERADATLPLVVKKDGRREPFDRAEDRERPAARLREAAGVGRHHRGGGRSDRAPSWSGASARCRAR